MNHENMKMTEVGWIPKDWEVKKVSDVATNSTGLTYSPDEVSSYGTLVLRSSNIQNDVLAFEDNVFVLMDIPERAIAHTGDILVCVRNGSRALIGKSAPITEKADGMAFGAFMTVLRATDINPQYLLYAWRSNIIQEQINATLGATINQITNADLKTFDVPFPTSPSEQRRIAQVLSDTDTLIASLSRTIEKKRLVKQGAMQQLLTGKTRLKGFSGKWVEKELGECADIYRGGSPRPIESFITTLPDGLNWIKIGDVANNAKYINKTAERIIPEGEKHSRFVRNGDLLLSNSMSFGRPYILRTDGCIHDGWLVIQNYQDEWHTDFLYYLLCSENVLKQYEILAAGSGVKNLNKNIVSHVALRYPIDLNEQIAIANILTTMDNEITSLEAELQKYKALKQGMMQKLLTGEIRLPICQITE